MLCGGSEEGFIWLGFGSVEREKRGLFTVEIIVWRRSFCFCSLVFGMIYLSLRG